MSVLETHGCDQCVWVAVSDGDVVCVCVTVGDGVGVSVGVGDGVGVCVCVGDGNDVSVGVAFGVSVCVAVGCVCCSGSVDVEVGASVAHYTVVCAADAYVVTVAFGSQSKSNFHQKNLASSCCPSSQLHLLLIGWLLGSNPHS